MTETPKRKLAAIMFTDMVGYTAMMERDEPKARETIERHRTIMKPLVPYGHRYFWDNYAKSIRI